MWTLKQCSFVVHDGRQAADTEERARERYHLLPEERPCERHHPLPDERPGERHHPLPEERACERHEGSWWAGLRRPFVTLSRSLLREQGG